MPERSGTFNTSGNEAFFGRVFAESQRTDPRWTVTIITHHFRVRRQLARLSFLIRRPRGRKMLGVKTSTRQITLYSVEIV